MVDKVAQPVWSSATLLRGGGQTFLDITTADTHYNKLDSDTATSSSPNHPVDHDQGK
jgi:hypothetical protein